MSTDLATTIDTPPCSKIEEEVRLIEGITDPVFAADLTSYFRGGYQCVQVVSPEEARAEREISLVAASLKRSVVKWDCAHGFTGVNFDKISKKGEDFLNPTKALLQVVETEANKDIFRGLTGGNTNNAGTVFIFRDLDDFENDPRIVRILRSLINGNKLSNASIKRPIIILSPLRRMAEKLKSCISILDFALPSESQLQRVVTGAERTTTNSLRKKNADAPEALCPEELREKIVQSLRGLTSVEADNAVARSMALHREWVPAMLTSLKDEKAQIIKRNDILEYIPESRQVDRADIAGYDLLMDYIDRRKSSYTKTAREHKIDFPRGIVVVGPPGTGKSYVATGVAKMLGLPQYSMDIGAVYGSLVGESEGRMRGALQQISAQNGSVLLIDEADKAFGGVTESTGDSGVSQRVFGHLLRWLQEHNTRTFVIMTMNRTTRIPPEMLRAGRFDDVFSTDLPIEAERKALFDIHLRKRGVIMSELKYTKAQMKTLLNKTKNYVHSEIERAVVEARYISWNNRQDGKPTADEMIEGVSAVKPAADRDAESLKEIREWCANNAKPVTTSRARRAKIVTDEDQERAVDLN